MLNPLLPVILVCFLGALGFTVLVAVVPVALKSYREFRFSSVMWPRWKLKHWDEAANWPSMAYLVPGATPYEVMGRVYNHQDRARAYLGALYSLTQEHVDSWHTPFDFLSIGSVNSIAAQLLDAALSGDLPRYMYFQYRTMLVADSERLYLGTGSAGRVVTELTLYADYMGVDKKAIQALWVVTMGPFE